MTKNTYCVLFIHNFNMLLYFSLILSSSSLFSYLLRLHRHAQILPGIDLKITEYGLDDVEAIVDSEAIFLSDFPLPLIIITITAR